MRLTHKEIESIKQVFLEIFGSGKIYLFGSRVDDTLKGGDISKLQDTVGESIIKSILK
jgi:hypothetical protein